MRSKEEHIKNRNRIKEPTPLRIYAGVIFNMRISFLTTTLQIVTVTDQERKYLEERFQAYQNQAENGNESSRDHIFLLVLSMGTKVLESFLRQAKLKES